MAFLESNRGYHAEVYRSIYDTSIKPTLRDLVREVMTSPQMDPGERLGKIIAYNEIFKGFLKMYENSKLETPAWIFEEFDL